MALDKLLKKYGSHNSNEFIIIGKTEAEAEALPTSSVPLRMVYEDYNNLLTSLSSENFIVIGRKGSGKSAFSEYVYGLSQDEPNVFCKFIRQDEANLEYLVQVGLDSGHPIERENLYRWLILTNILKLFHDNRAIENNNDYALLGQFLKKNSGFIDIRKSEIKELVEKQGFEVSIEYLKRYLRSKRSKSLEIKQEKAPFYKLIPHLREVILNVLTSSEEIQNENSYILFFDDLDIAFNSSSQNSIDALVSLLRVTKEINNEFFGKNNIDSKVILLLRDDISKSLAGRATDTGKIFTSYASYISWYQDEYHQTDSETDLNIRKFVNKRIKYAFDKINKKIDSDDPWKSLVQDPFIDDREGYSKTSFKYILDHTFFRPRDIILFFKPLENHSYKIPLDRNDVNHLIGRYCDEVINELKDELSCFYSSDQIIMLFNAIGQISRECKASKNNSCSYSKAVIAIKSNCTTIEPNSMLSDLFERSIIGNIAENKYAFFKYREPKNSTYTFNKEMSIILHNSIKVYTANKGYA